MFRALNIVLKNHDCSLNDLWRERLGIQYVFKVLGLMNGKLKKRHWHVQKYARSEHVLLSNQKES